MKIAWSNSSFDESKFVIVGVPDSSQSLSNRRSKVQAPSRIRKASQRSYFKHDHGSVTYEPEIGRPGKIHDYGDISKSEILSTVSKLLKAKKIPCFIGGDHSITYHILKSCRKKGLSIVWFDAHPDFTFSEEPKHDAVFEYLVEEKIINPNTSAMVGIRAADPQENENLKKSGLLVIRPHHLEELGIKKALELIKKKVKPPIYLSIDMDCLDPAFAPGVSTPEPGGLSSRELLYLARETSQLGLIGFDIVEVVPEYDFQDMTSHLASNLIREIIANCK